MAGQDFFTRKTEISLPGNLFGSNHVIEPLVLEAGAAPFGYGVVAGTDEQDAVLPAGAPALADIRGVARRNPNIERIWKSTDDPTYTADEDPVMDVVRKGFIWVAATAVITRGEAVFLQHTLNGQNFPGSFRNGIDGGNALDVSSLFSWFRGNENVGDLAVLEVHIIK